VADDIEVRLNTKGGRERFHAAKREILAALARATAAGAVVDSPHVSGFLASTVVAVPPGGDGVPARDERAGGEHKRSVRVPPADENTAIVAVAAIYAMYVELRHPFLLEAAIRAATRLDAYVRAEAL
jgi:hypothetical protein